MTFGGKKPPKHQDSDTNTFDESSSQLLDTESDFTQDTDHGTEEWIQKRMGLYLQD